MKSAPLKDLVNWIEQAHTREGPCGSHFETPVATVLAIKAEAALAWTLATGQPVVVFTGNVSAKAVLAALVLRRSGVSLQNIFHNLEEEHFERMTCCLAEIRRSGLEILDGPPPQADLGAAFFGGPLYAVLRRQPPQGEVMTEKQRRIIAVWEEIERADEDISTECLLAQTAHRMTERGCYTTEEQVVEALQAEHQEKMLVRKAER